MTVHLDAAGASADTGGNGSAGRQSAVMAAAPGWQARRILLVVQQPALLAHMERIVRTTPGAELIRSFSNTADAVDWITWEGRRIPWHAAFVDEKCAVDEGAAKPLLRAPLGGGKVVAVVDHLWREVRTRCASVGIYDIVERGDLVAFQDCLERLIRQTNVSSSVDK
jgi:hypothetical protein